MKIPSGDEALDLVRILRHDLPADFPADSSSLTPDEQRQLDEAKDRLLTELVIGHDEQTRQAVFATKLDDFESFIAGHHARTALAELGIDFLVFTICDKVLYGRQLYGHTPKTSREEYFSRAAPRLKLEASDLHNRYFRGYVLENFQFILLNPSDGVPGLTLEFIARNRTKLIDFPEAVRRHGSREALAHFRADSSRDFSTWTKYELPTAAAQASSDPDGATPEAVASAAAEAEKAQAVADARKAANMARAEARCKTLAEQQACTDAEVAQFDDDERTVVRIIQAGYVPFIATAPEGRAFFLDHLEERLAGYRDKLTRQVADSLVRSDFDPSDPVNLHDGLGSIGSIFEAEDRIRAANLSIAEGKRTVYHICFRLYNEPDLIAQQRELGFTSLQAYSEARLDIGSEVYAYAAIGRALVKYRFLVADLPDHDSDAFFKKVAHLERAVQTHRGNYAAIRHAITTLSPKDFKTFSANADFTERQFQQPVTPEQIEQAHDFFMTMRHNRLYGHAEAMKLIALYDRDESRIVYWIFRDLEKELVAGTLQLPAACEPASVVDATNDEHDQKEGQTVTETA